MPLAAATLALAFAALTPTRIALPALGAVAGVGLAVVLLSRVPFGPLARPAEPPESFLDAQPRAVRVLLAGERPRVLRGVLPDVGLAAVPPPLGPDTEAAAASAVATHGLDDLRGAMAARLHALGPLARFDPAESARRLAALYERNAVPGRAPAWPPQRGDRAGSPPVRLYRRRRRLGARVARVGHRREARAARAEAFRRGPRGVVATRRRPTIDRDRRWTARRRNRRRAGKERRASWPPRPPTA